MHYIPPPAVEIKDPLLFLGRTPILVDFTRRNWGQETPRPVPNWVTSTPEAGNCWRSQSRYNPGMHLPCFDVDVPRTPEVYAKIKLVFPESPPCWVPSSTEGHHHVYINYGYTWDDYAHRLHQLSSMITSDEIIAFDYVKVSLRQMATHVRFPHVKKTQAEIAEIEEDERRAKVHKTIRDNLSTIELKEVSNYLHQLGNISPSNHSFGLAQDTSVPWDALKQFLPISSCGASA